VEKLRLKKLDAIVANDISRSDIGFNATHNEVLLLFANGETLTIPRSPKPLYCPANPGSIIESVSRCPRD
jgi:phosphopantothenoylcysteine synthetase/decarboxylase